MPSIDQLKSRDGQKKGKKEEFKDIGNEALDAEDMISE